MDIAGFCMDKKKCDLLEYIYKTQKGLSSHVVCQISEKKNEPGWMTDFRLKALTLFESLPMPKWGCDISSLDPSDIHFYLKPTEQQGNSWDTIPPKIKKTFEKLGILEAEHRFLAGLATQYESEVIYKSLMEKWKNKGVIFLDTGEGLRQYPELFKRYFASVIPPSDNKFAALNSAVWSGGSFIIVPKGVHIDMPLQAYFRIDASSFGQFERTLIIAQEGSSIEYVEGCSAPVYKKNSLHSAVVEVIALSGSKVRYTTIQNWSDNIYNLVTKRAFAYKDAQVEWIDGNFGSKVTMKYPSIVLKESGAKAQIISISVAKAGQHQDAGGKIIHEAPHTSSNFISKSISQDGGRSSFRGLVKVADGAKDVKASMNCDALLLDSISRSDTYPTIIVKEKSADVGHEASVSKLDDEQLFYIQSRGLSHQKAKALVVNGFIDAFVSKLPMEYAVEINRLIASDIEGF